MQKSSQVLLTLPINLTADGLRILRILRDPLQQLHRRTSLLRLPDAIPILSLSYRASHLITRTLPIKEPS